MMVDPTTNRIQTEHLEPEEQAALENWPHGWEVFSVQGFWVDCAKPIWLYGTVYRGKPAPVVTSVWFNRYAKKIYGPYSSRREANDCACPGVIDLLHIDTCNGVSTAHLKALE